jgi:hypothetical protein
MQVLRLVEFGSDPELVDTHLLYDFGPRRCPPPGRPHSHWGMRTQAGFTRSEKAWKVSRSDFRWPSTGRGAVVGVSGVRLGSRPFVKTRPMPRFPEVAVASD